MELRISETSAASPDMSDLAFAELVENIRKYGQLVPIVVRNGEIIDGRKRFAACQRLGIEPSVVDISPDQDAEALSYSLNVLRTHYTPSQLAMSNERRATAREGNPQLNKFVQLRSRTLADVARESGISRGTLVAARAVRRKAAPEVVAAVEAGRLTLHAAQQIMREPMEAQPDIAARAIAASSASASRYTPTASILGKVAVKRLPTKPVAERIERALDQLDSAAEMLGQWLAEPAATAHRDFASWITRIERSRAALSKTINLSRRSA